MKLFVSIDILFFINVCFLIVSPSLSLSLSLSLYIYIYICIYVYIYIYIYIYIYTHVVRDATKPALPCLRHTVDGGACPPAWNGSSLPIGVLRGTGPGPWLCAWPSGVCAGLGRRNWNSSWRSTVGLVTQLATLGWQPKGRWWWLGRCLPSGRPLRPCPCKTNKTDLKKKIYIYIYIYIYTKLGPWGLFLFVVISSLCFVISVFFTSFLRFSRYFCALYVIYVLCTLYVAFYTSFLRFIRNFFAVYVMSAKFSICFWIYDVFYFWHHHIDVKTPGESESEVGSSGFL